MRPHTLAAAIVFLLAVTACGGTGSDAGTGSDRSDQLSITSPDDGASVQLPFTVSWDSTAPLGPVDSGRDHVHVYLDGEDSDYQVASGTRLRVKNLSPGEHTLVVSLRNADHSPAGAEASIDVTVGGGGSPTPSDGDGGGGGGGYGY